MNCMTRNLNVTPKTTLRSGKFEASVTVMKDSARVIVLLRLTTDGRKASRGLSATAELLVYVNYRATRMHSADYAVASVCPTVCLSVCHMQVFCLNGYTLEALRNALYKFKTYLLTYLYISLKFFHHRDPGSPPF